MGYDNQKSVWVIGYGRVMGYQYEIPANRLGKLKNLCVIKEYGLYGVWVISESTVCSCRCRSLAYVTPVIRGNGGMGTEGKERKR
jgi:hypothetical protein